MVSVDDERAGGYSVHTTRIFVGVAANLGSPVRLGNGKDDFKAPVGVSGIVYNLSERSVLYKSTIPWR